MLLLNYILFSLIFPKIFSNLRMIEMYGDTDKNGKLIGTDWNRCLRYCLDNYFCGWNDTVIVTKKSSLEKVKVAWKRELNSCPVNRNPPLFGESSVTESNITDNTYYSYVISQKSKTSWTFSKQVYTGCEVGAKVSVRGKNVVCLTVRPFGACFDYTTAQKTCKKGNGLGITGPYSGEETAFFEAANRVALSSTSKYLPSQVYKWNIWIDGQASPPNWSLTDKTLLNTDNYPFPTIPPAAFTGTCLFFQFSKSTPGIKAMGWPCEASVGVFHDFCFFGVACRIAPVGSFSL